MPVQNDSVDVEKVSVDSPDSRLSNLSSNTCEGNLSLVSRSLLSALTLLSTGSSKNTSLLFCRICHEGEQLEKLISPCRCSGTMGLVHKSCCERWLSSCNQDTCELCKQQLRVERRPQPFVKWLAEPSVGDDQRNLMGDFVCFLLLTPLAGVSVFLCTSGAIYYIEQAKQSEAVGLVCLSFLLLLTYFLWLLLTLRYHCKVWGKWRRSHQDIRLVEESDASQQAFLKQQQPSKKMVGEPSPQPYPVPNNPTPNEVSSSTATQVSSNGTCTESGGSSNNGRNELLIEIRQHFESRNRSIA